MVPPEGLVRRSRPPLPTSPLVRPQTSSPIHINTVRETRQSKVGKGSRNCGTTPRSVNIHGSPRVRGCWTVTRYVGSRVRLDGGATEVRLERTAIETSDDVRGRTGWTGHTRVRCMTRTTVPPDTRTTLPGPSKFRPIPSDLDLLPSLPPSFHILFLTKRDESVVSGDQWFISPLQRGVVVLDIYLSKRDSRCSLGTFNQFGLLPLCQ